MEETEPKRKRGRPKKPAPIGKKSTRKKRVLKTMTPEDRMNDYIKSLNERFGPSLCIEIAMYDDLSKQFLRKATINTHRNSEIFYTDTDVNKADMFSREIYNLPNTMDRVMYLNHHNVGLGFGSVLIFGTRDSANKFQEKMKGTPNWEESYEEIVVLEEF